MEWEAGLKIDNQLA